MSVLIISPDFVSHYNPLSELARAAAGDGRRVVVATGHGLRPLVEKQGHRWCHLRLGAGSNTGTVADDPSIAGFLAATAAGPLATIAHQAEQRERDLLWQPERIVAEVARLLDDLDPEDVVVDHVSFASTLALYASGRPFTTLVPGHPSQLPVGPERYGVPPVWPSTMTPSAGELAPIEQLADRVTRRFTDRWNAALVASGSSQPTVDDAFRVHGGRVGGGRDGGGRAGGGRVGGGRVLYNSVGALADPDRMALLSSTSRFVGPLVRPPSTSDGFRSWLERDGGRPQVYVGLGTFLARRADVLARIAEGLRRAEATAAIAVGPTPLDSLGPIPDHWHVAPTLPQVELLSTADLVIHHGGNNSVQESLAAGVPQIIMPFSTDQFANAADLERCRSGVVLSPNEATAGEIAEAVEGALRGPAMTAVQPLTMSELAERAYGDGVDPGQSRPSTRPDAAAARRSPPPRGACATG